VRGREKNRGEGERKRRREGEEERLVFSVIMLYFSVT
jgi:hypothetical protein